MKPIKLFHINERSDIKIFKLRPSTSNFDKIKGDVVFAISDKMLHNYILPRCCSRVTFYSKSNSSKDDTKKFFQYTSAEFVIAIESKWLPAIQKAKLYCYEFSAKTFTFLDKCTCYYISYHEVKPIAARRIDNNLQELLEKNIELRIMPLLHQLTKNVAQSTLNFSIIRIRNSIDNDE